MGLAIGGETTDRAILVRAPASWLTLRKREAHARAL